MLNDNHPLPLRVRSTGQPTIGYAGRRVQMLQRALAEPLGHGLFLDVNHVADHLATLRLSCDDQRGPAAVFARDRDNLVTRIRAARTAFLSAGGGLVAIQFGSPRRWQVLHARSGVCLSYFTDPHRKPWTMLGQLHTDRFDLSGTAVAAYVAALEGLSDPRGHQVDWNAELPDLDASLARWHDHTDTGDLPQPGTSAIYGGMTGLHLAALFHAISADPMRDAASTTLGRALAVWTLRADAVWIRGRHAHPVVDHLNELRHRYHHGRRRDNYDLRTREQLLLDRDTGKIATLALVYAFGGEPHRAVDLLRHRADIVRAHDSTRRDGLTSSTLTGAALRIATLFSPQATEIQRLRDVEVGDHIAYPGNSHPHHGAPRHVWRVLEAAHDIVTGPGGAAWFNLAVHDLVDDRSGRMVVRPGLPNPVCVDYTDSQWSGMDIVGEGWALVPAGAGIPTSQDILDLAQAAARAFDDDRASGR